MMKNLVLVGCIATLGNAHDWMTAPASRNGNSASTSGPCPAGTDPAQANMKVELGQDFDVSWADNHNGNHYVKIALLTQEGEIASMAEDELVFYGQYDTSDTPVTVSIDNVLEGMYVLQWSWSNYQNCATIQVVGDGASTSGLNADPVTADSTVNCVNYCEDFDKYCSAYTNWTYASHDACLLNCGTFPQGEVTDVTGNTLYCREHHLHVEGGLPADHCPHASYDGADKCIGGDFLPAFTIDIVSAGTTTDAVWAELNEAFSAYDATVVVTESATLGTYIASVQFKSDDGWDIVDGYLADEGAAVSAMLATTDIQVDELIVLGGYSAAVGAGTSTTTVRTHTIVAAVMLPLALIATIGAFFFFKETIHTKCLSKAINRGQVISMSAGLQVASWVLLMVLMASSTWSSSGDISFGLFRYTIASSSESFSMAGYDVNARAVIESVQAFVTLAMLANLAGGVLTTLMCPYVNKVNCDPVHVKAIACLTAFTSVIVFLGLCLYAAYFNDVLAANFEDISLGWCLDLMGVYWAISLFSFALSFRLHLDISSGKASPQVPKTIAV